MSTDVSSAENEGGAPIRTARVPKYYRLKKHLLDMTETLPPGTPVPPERTLAAEARACPAIPPRRKPAA